MEVYKTSINIEWFFGEGTLFGSHMSVLKGAVFGQMGTDLLVLVSCDCGENSLGEVEGFHTLPAGYWFSWGELTAEVLPDHMDTRLISVHGV